MSKLIRERPWAEPSSPPSVSGRLPVVPVISGSLNGNSQTKAEPLVWVHQTELFETAGDATNAGRPPYEAVLDWYPDVSHLWSFSAFHRSVALADTCL